MSNGELSQVCRVIVQDSGRSTRIKLGLSDKNCDLESYYDINLCLNDAFILPDSSLCFSRIGNIVKVVKKQSFCVKRHFLPALFLACILD
ncbi:hypothetical protein RCL_jg18686.t1 [Rhizophagus clarus]|uniref:Uncharacterized protein n=1 Tax=Rhizophagus clarus TaxID=94130 RepID=A0A8H3LJG9_9GLOM|nr:hypothetical protein RCL_jg18686.t1 [Rhizophagus clarus]